MGRRKHRPFKHGTSAPAPQGTVAREEPSSGSVVRMRSRGEGETLPTIDELRHMNQSLQARLASLQGQDRQTLEALASQVRERDERIRELERSVRALEGELSQRGEGVNLLRLRERELAARVEALEIELQAAREALLDAQAQDDQTTSTALIAAFRNLVTRDLPKWSDQRDHFLRNADRMQQRVVDLRNQAQRTLFLLRSSLERSTDMTGELALKHAGATGVDADELAKHELAIEIRDLWEAWQELSREFDEKNQERREFLLRDADDRRVRDQLRGKIESFVRAFALAGLDVWELAQLDKSTLALLDDRTVEIEVVRTSFEIDRVSAREREDIAQATRSIVLTPPAVEKPRSGGTRTDAALAPVSILPGSVFPVQKERELERLCLLVVLAWEQTSSSRLRRPSAADIRTALLSSKLVPKETALSQIAAALKAARHVQALTSGSVRDGEYLIEVYASGARAPVCRDEALDLLPASTRERVFELITQTVAVASR